MMASSRRRFNKNRRVTLARYFCPIVLDVKANPTPIPIAPVATVMIVMPIIIPMSQGGAGTGIGGRLGSPAGMRWRCMVTLLGNHVTWQMPKPVQGGRLPAQAIARPPST
jgi:hypothetical protein